MAQDAWVKDAELLSGFASDLRETQASILGHLSRLSSAAYQKEAAESLCHRIAEDLNDARSTLDQALFLLQGLRSVAEGFSSRAGHLAETAAANVDAAAFEIAQYKTIR